ncbi:MAG: hypothetical protein QXJ02_06070 [Candidatus Bathyarchaeia archaeon]
MTKAVKRNSCTIEVDVPSGSEGWQEFVSRRMKEELDKFRSVVEELGGRVCVRY